MEVRNPKTIVFWKSKTQSSMKPTKKEESSQHKLIEAQNLEDRGSLHQWL